MAPTQLSSRPETGLSRRRKNVPLLCSSCLSSPVSWSEEGTKSGWENILFHWVKIYYRGNGCCRVPRRARGGLREGVVLRILGTVLPAAPGEDVSSWQTAGVQLRLWTQARRVSPLLFRGKGETPAAGGITDCAKGAHVGLWNPGGHTCAWAFRSDSCGSKDGPRGAAGQQGPRDPGRERSGLCAHLVPTS